MKVYGMTKTEIMKYLSADGKQALEEGTMTIEEAGAMAKMAKVREASKVGRYGDTFRANFERVPDKLFEELPPEDVASIVDALYDAYSDGKSAVQ